MRFPKSKPYDGSFHRGWVLAAAVVLGALEAFAVYARSKRRADDYQAGRASTEPMILSLTTSLGRCVTQKHTAFQEGRHAAEADFLNSADLLVSGGEVIKNRYGDDTLWTVRGEIALYSHDEAERSQEPSL